MKLRSLLKKLMVMVAVLLLMVSIAMDATAEHDGASVHTFLWLITLIVLVGVLGFLISEKMKPLDWTIAGSFLGASICLCEVLEISSAKFSGGWLCILFMAELLLSAGYRIGSWFHIFD